MPYILSRCLYTGISSIFFFLILIVFFIFNFNPHVCVCVCVGGGSFIANTGVRYIIFSQVKNLYFSNGCGGGGEIFFQNGRAFPRLGGERAGEMGWFPPPLVLSITTPHFDVLSRCIPRLRRLRFVCWLLSQVSTLPVQVTISYSLTERENQKHDL